MHRYPVSRIFVVNPPVLGVRRRKVFEQQFRGWRKSPPPISWIGVNKNHLAAVNESRYRHWIRDDRSAWVRLKLRMGWEKNAEHFPRVYDSVLCTRAKVTAVVEIGRVANAMSHLKIWEQGARMTDDELFMVVEDDVVINPEMDFDRVSWPQGAELLHLWPGGVVNWKVHSEDYVEIMRGKRIKKDGLRYFNWTSLGYIMTPACARRYLLDLRPHIVNRTIDMQIWYAGNPRAFAVRKPWVRPQYVTTLVQALPLYYLLAREVLYHLRFLLPSAFRKRHPYLLGEPYRFDTPRLD